MGFKRGRAVISPQAGEPSPHLCLLPASLIKCGLCAERAQRPLCRWRTQTLFHTQFPFRQELVWLQEGGRTQAGYHVSVWQCVFFRWLRPLGEMTVALRLGTNELLMLVKPDSFIAHTDLLSVSLQCHVASVPLSKLCTFFFSSPHLAEACLSLQHKCALVYTCKWEGAVWWDLWPEIYPSFTREDNKINTVKHMCFTTNTDKMFKQQMSSIIMGSSPSW